MHELNVHIVALVGEGRDVGVEVGKAVQTPAELAVGGRLAGRRSAAGLPGDWRSGWRSIMCQAWVEFNAMSGNIGCHLWPKSAPTWTKPAQFGSIPGQLWSRLAQLWPDSAQGWQIPAKFGRHWSKCRDRRSNLVGLTPILA